MTTFQDPQPQSRRAMRASERGDTVEPTPEVPANDASAQAAPFVAPVPLVEPEVRSTSYPSPLPSFDAGQFRNRADARENAPLATQALPQVEQPDYQPRDAAAQASTPAEPSPFVTAPLSESLAAAAPPAAETVHAYEAPPAEHTLTRRELRALRESGAPVPSAAPETQAAPSPVTAHNDSVVAPPSWGEPVAPPVASAPAPVAATPAAPIASAPIAPAPAATEAAPEAPAAGFDFANLFEVPADPTPEPPTPVAAVESTPVDSSAPQAWPFGVPLTPSSEKPSVSGVVEAEIVEPAAAGATPSSDESDDSKSPFSFFRRSKRESVEAPAPEAAAPHVVDEQPAAALFAPQESVATPQPEVASAAPVEPQAQAAEPQAQAVEPQAQTEIPRLVEPLPASVQHVDASTVSPFDALFTPKSAGATDAMPATQAWSAPVGHWSTQADLDDESQPHESTINRRVGTGSSATSALVLPSIPEGSDIRGPLTESGQITLTGSIDLSQALGSTGSTDRLENKGMDALFELHDAEAISTDSAPVRAIRAVSTHNTGHGVTHTQKPKGNRALTGLLIAASSMAVVVAGLLVAALAFKLF